MTLGGNSWSGCVTWITRRCSSIVWYDRRVLSFVMPSDYMSWNIFTTLLCIFDGLYSSCLDSMVSRSASDRENDRNVS